MRNVAVIVTQPTLAPDLIEAAGTVRAEQTSELASQMMGSIVELRAHEGDHVQRGQVLAVIDESQPRAALDRATAAENAAGKELAAADADLSLAESTLQRYQRLYERKSVSPQEFDEVSARQKAAQARSDAASAGEAQAKAAVTQAHTSLGYTRIRAPFDGVITEKKADTGTLASPGTPVFTVEDVRRYRLEVAVNENDLQYVRLGQEAAVTIDALGTQELRGRVAQIVPAADAASRSFLVKIELPPDARLRSGLFGRTQFTRGQRSTLLIPRTAVIERGQLQGVFVLDQNQIAGLRYVSLGKPSASRVEVLAGLQAGERLVAEPGEADLNGKKIESR
ncbi:MAG TPA: efflux RND transporter periplasmic adaptor subunit [Terriglobales bacterium]|nr:efflux RND transporter periplasmic adaptor subunit [Terriglobales bacterium]